ncbi:MAG TPA: Crp/Fnr family transcriptional regulator [Lachnospiraceae bacterium]|nr:Crp/Fnr family transcriptional regulator [Lachnospiraceae bacterium]
MLKLEETDFLSRNLPFWKQLTNVQKELFLSNARTTHYIKGQSLLSDQSECLGLLFIKSGILRTYITSEEGREITLYRLEDQDICILSASCVLKTIDFDVFIDAETDCDVIQIGSPILSRIMAENVYVELFSYKLATERFSDVMWAMQQLLFISFDKRLAAFLLEEAARCKCDSIRMTHEQIAKYIGSAREVVSRMLKYFSEEGYITLARGDITIIDKRGLKAIL